LQTARRATLRFMLTGVFKDRSAKDRVARERAANEEQALAELLAARELRGFALSRQCEIGPFVVEYLFAEQSLIVELASAAPAEDSPAVRRRAERLKFFNDMGYDVLCIAPAELMRQPQRALARLLAVLRKDT
jgi:very-short-patch-repair endonuclease